MAEGLRTTADRLELVAMAYADAETPEEHRIHELFHAAAAQIIGLGELCVAVASAGETHDGFEVTADHLHPAWLKEFAALERKGNLPPEARRLCKLGNQQIRATTKRAKKLMEALAR